MHNLLMTAPLVEHICDSWTEIFNDGTPDFREYAALVGSMPLVKNIESGLINCALGLSGEFEEYRQEVLTLGPEEAICSGLGDVWWYGVQAWCTFSTWEDLPQLELQQPGPYSDNRQRWSNIHKHIGAVSEITKKVVIHGRSFEDYESRYRMALRQLFQLLTYECSEHPTLIWAYNITKLVNRYGYTPASAPKWVITNPKESV